MLVLSRKLNETIVIDGGITVTVVKIDKHHVRLGIEAPGDVKVLREELVEGRTDDEQRDGQRRREEHTWAGGFKRGRA